MKSAKMEVAFVAEGLSIYRIPFENFKTNTITLSIHDDLSKESVAKNALIPAILKQGSLKYPSKQELAWALKDLYGAVFDSGVSKKGERQILHFYMETIKDLYGNSDESLTEKSLELFFEVVFNPLVSQRSFSHEIVETEMKNMKKLIEGKLNDKIAYVYERCTEKMCHGEAYALSEIGDLEDYEGLTPENLYEHYQKLLQTNPISIYVTGEVSDLHIEKIKEKILAISRPTIKKIKETTFKDAPAKSREFSESLNINQGKLCMGYRTNIAASNHDYYQLMVCNSILGGGIHSKLFQNVREKEGLAYYVYSRLDRFKGLMFVNSGIDSKNKEKVIAIVNQQLKDISHGNIKEEEFFSAKKQLISGLNAMRDSQMTLTDFYMSASILSVEQTLDEFIKKIDDVTKDEVMEISKLIQLDTVYFLHGKEMNNDEDSTDQV